MVAVALGAALFLPLGLFSANALQQSPLIQRAELLSAANNPAQSNPLRSNLRLSSSAPEVIKVSSFLTPQNQLTLRLSGSWLSEVRRVLVDGVPTSFFLNSENLITARIPVEAKPGDVTITLQGAFGSLELNNYLSIPGADAPTHPNIQVASNPGELSITAKDLEGERLSVNVGSRWQVIEKIPNNLTILKFSIEPDKTITVMVFLDRKLSQISQIQTD
jgi:hypothetical protein